MGVLRTNQSRKYERPAFATRASCQHVGERLLRFRSGVTLLMCAVVLAVGGRLAAAEENQTQAAAERTFLTRVFGEERRPDFDLLVLRDGRRVTGRLLNDQFTLRTSIGRVSLKATHVAGIRFAGPADLAATLVCINNDHLSGLLESIVLEVRLADGQTLTARSEAGARLVRRGLPHETDGLPPGQFVLLKNGDRFAAQFATNQFAMMVAGTNRLLTLDSADSIRFSSDHPAGAKIVLRDSTSFVGDWPEDDLELTLVLGPAVRVYRDWIDTIYCQPGFRPPDDRIPATGGPGSLRAIAGMVWIAPGRFVMGSPTEEAGRDFDEAPLTEVTLTGGFWMGEREVTQAEFKAVTGANPSQFVGDPTLPVERVSWREAVSYCENLNQRWAAEGRLPEGHAFRLPTEAEWEYACRAGTTTRFSHGDDPDARRLSEFAWFGDNSDSTSHPVGTRRPNPWGLCDLPGNVLEWCQDAAAAYPGGSVTNYVGQSGRSLLRVARGGSWLYGASAARSANRDTYTETTRCSDLGFRVVLAPVSGGRP